MHIIVVRSDSGQVNLILGLLIVLGSSALNAFGLNLTKLDHVSLSDILVALSLYFPVLPPFSQRSTALSSLHTLPVCPRGTSRLALACFITPTSDIRHP
jgi:hypothetical protein